MKTKFFVLLIAVLSLMTAGFVSAANPPATPPTTPPTNPPPYIPNPSIPIKDITTPNTPAGDPKGIQRALGLSNYVTGQIDLDLGLLTLNFVNEVEDIVVYVYHSELGLIATIEADYSANPTALIPIPDVQGKYTIKIFGTDYEAEGEYCN